MAMAALALAKRARRVYPRGGFDGLDAVELQVILSLWLEPRRRVRDLADALALPRPSVSSAVARLTAKELVSSLRDPADGRAAHQQLTRVGSGVVRRFLSHAAEHL
jgi:DNA-binding MarR family transcriptional regulator